MSLGVFFFLNKDHVQFRDCPQSELVALVSPAHDPGVKPIILAWTEDAEKNIWALYSH